jgi:butyryl-CoA dehydrogenase
MLTELQQELKSSLSRFCLERLEPTAREDDQEHRFRMELFNQLGELGFCGMTAKEEHGGMELTTEDLTVALNEIAKYSVSYAVTISVSSMVQGVIEKFGNQEQKKRYLPAMAQGEEIGAFALTESGAGSDAASLTTRAVKNENGYLLNGNKIFITSGGIAKTYIVMARTGGEGARGISAFIVRDGTKGFSYGKAEEKMGWKVSPTRELVFENCQIPADALLGSEGDGFTVAMTALDRGRITIGAIGAGLAERALSEATQYALTRQQFSQEIFNFQGIQFMLADMACEVEVAKLIVREAAQLYEQQDPTFSKIAAMAKLKATDVAMRVTTDAVQVLGGVGYTSEYPVERFMRDAKVLQIVEGTNQIQRVVIARHLMKELKKD